MHTLTRVLLGYSTIIYSQATESVKKLTSLNISTVFEFVFKSYRRHEVKFENLLLTVIMK
jgi:hypothetical protein